MYSGLISKIEKARKYAEEPHRISLLQFTAHFQGDNADHSVTFDNGKWTCTCSFFTRHHTCSHTMALEHLLGNMIPAESMAQD